ncbi:hypothetical protein XI03_06325 [Bradyrhizobium sp. CCBAU 65884]|nr:hypothetical protein [Bradyrhizobium sp. CCBAU 65884]
MVPTQLVVKVASHCNIACKYCYMYFRGDESYKSTSRRISRETVAVLGLRINEYIEEYGLEHVIVTFHGGEPLLVGKRYFKEMLDELLSICSADRLGFTVQTNGTLLDNEWIELLARYKVNVGISLDGPRLINDRWRVDHKGKGTYAEATRGLVLAQSAADLRFRGVITVIDPSISGREYYEFMTSELCVERMNILLPDADHDTMSTYVKSSLNEFSSFLMELFDEWWKDYPRTNIRFFEDIINKIVGADASSDLVGSAECRSIIIDSDGDIEAHDVSRINKSGAHFEFNVHRDSISRVFDDPTFKKLNQTERVPQKCSECPVYNICRSGFVPHRYSRENGYNNPSIYCEVLFNLIYHIYFKLLTDGCSPMVHDAPHSQPQWA